MLLADSTFLGHEADNGDCRQAALGLHFQQSLTLCCGPYQHVLHCMQSCVTAIRACLQQRDDILS